VNPTKQIGTFPTAYGVAVPVFEAIGHADPESVTFDLSGTMTCAGIHDPGARDACRAELHNGAKTGQIDWKTIERFGGRPVPRIKLPIPTEAIYPTIPDDESAGPSGSDGPSIRQVLDHWVTAVTDHHRWCDRADKLLWLLEGQYAALKTMPDALAGIALGNLVTAVLENLGEHEIECIEAAGFYLLSSHEDWRHAGRSWLMSMRSTWFADWVAARPSYRRFADLVRAATGDVPAWASEVTR
jgi:hypothetical protein